MDLKSHQQANHQRSTPYPPPPADPFANNRPRLIPPVGNDLDALVMALGDQRGFIYIFDFSRGRWFLLARTGVSVSSLAFSRTRSRELFVGLADRSILCYNIDSSSLLAKLPPHHTQPPTLLSPHPTRPFLISQSPSEAVLWTTDKWTRVRVLAGTEGAGGVVWAGYAPRCQELEGSLGEHAWKRASGGSQEVREERQLAMALFADGSVMVWEAETMELRWKIELRENPRGAVRAVPSSANNGGAGGEISANGGGGTGLGKPPPTEPVEKVSIWDPDAPASLAVSRDLEILVVGGRYRRGEGAPTTSLLVWSLPTRTLLHEIALPNLGSSGVSHILFLGVTDVCAVLSGDGRCVFVDAVGAGYVGKVEGLERFHSIALSPSGRFLAAISHPSHHLLSFLSTDGVVTQGGSRMLGPAFLKSVEDEALGERRRWEEKEEERSRWERDRGNRGIGVHKSLVRETAGREMGWEGEGEATGLAAGVGLLAGDMGIPPEEEAEEEVIVLEEGADTMNATPREVGSDTEPAYVEVLGPAAAEIPARRQPSPARPAHPSLRRTASPQLATSRPVSAPPARPRNPANAVKTGPRPLSANPPALHPPRPAVQSSLSIRPRSSTNAPWRPPSKVPPRGVRTARQGAGNGLTSEKKMQQREPVKVPGTLYELVEMTVGVCRRLLRFLRHYHAYPSKYRTLIWRFQLRLPENRDAYATLLERGVHPVGESVRRKFPMKSVRNERAMIRLMSAFCHWSPIFGSLDYFPGMIFPFIKAFGNDTFDCFEAIMTIVSNWCQNWWDYYPNPPFEYLDVIEDLLALHDRELLSHFMRNRITSQTYAWLLLRTLFSDVLYREEWLTVWDHILSNEVGWMQQWVVGYLRAGKGALMSLSKVEDFEYFFSHPTSVDVPRTIRYAYEQAENTAIQYAPKTYLNPFRPIARGGSYPLFNKYPSFIVDYQKKLRDKIKEEEEEYTRRKVLADEVSRLGDELRRDKREWESGDGRMSDALENWWTGMLAEEEAHAEKIRKLDELEKGERVRTMREIAQARRVFMDQQAQNTAKHLNLLSRAVESNRTRQAAELEGARFNMRISDVESEWLMRRDELMAAREVLRKTDRLRMERLVKHTAGAPVDSFPHPTS
ncbi:TBC1 domain member 31 [Gonapodya sp. JEL0774]|nr:TBC1 domain member 31 [Gonapodya sp. JEL0774]